MLSKINNLRFDLSKVITLTEDLYNRYDLQEKSDQRYLQQAYDKLRIAQSWLTDMATEIREVEIEKIYSIDILKLFPDWNDISLQDKLNIILGKINSIYINIINLYDVQNYLNQETRKNYEQAKLSEDNDFATQEILQQLYTQLDGEIIDFDEQIYNAKKLVKEAKFFLTFILEKY